MEAKSRTPGSYFAAAAASAAIAGGIATFCGWWFGVPSLIDWFSLGVTMKANRITVQAGEIVLRGSSGATEELATKTFVEQVFDTHTHPSGVGPTGPPTLPSTTNPRSLTKVVTAE